MDGSNGKIKIVIVDLTLPLWILRNKDKFLAMMSYYFAGNVKNISEKYRNSQDDICK